MESKLSGQNEVLGRAAELGIEAVVLNPASIMGPGDINPGSALNRLHRMVLRLPLLPSFSGTLGVVDVRDVSRAAVMALCRGEPGRCYLLAAANVSYADVLRTMAHHLLLRRRVVTLPGWLTRAAAEATEALASARRATPALPAAYGQLSAWRCAYRSARSRAEFGDMYRPFDRTVADGCDFFLANCLNN
jgi:nucleoside-diphosphate-sugar epimerase